MHLTKKKAGSGSGKVPARSPNPSLTEGAGPKMEIKE